MQENPKSLDREEEWPVRAMRSLRMLLIKNGLDEDMADAFLSRLQAEAARATLSDDVVASKRCEAIIRELVEQRSSPIENERQLRIKKINDIVRAVLLGAAGSALWDAFKSLPEVLVPAKGATKRMRASGKKTNKLFLESIVAARLEHEARCLDLLLSYHRAGSPLVFEALANPSGFQAVRIKNLGDVRKRFSFSIDQLAGISGLTPDAIARMELEYPVEPSEGVRLLSALDGLDRFGTP